MLELVAKYRINEYSDILGLFITVLGFGLTLWNVRRSRLLARQAVDIAEQVRNQMRKVDSIAELGAAIAAMEAVKNYARARHFAVIPDRLSELKRRLIELRSLAGNVFSENDLHVLQSAITQLAVLEKKLDKAAENKADPSGWSRDNAILSEHIDKVLSILVGIKSTGVGP